jgi:2-amino-4-hydroxy-6-hydroxymethyldihydropteridine diphosphokinase
MESPGPLRHAAWISLGSNLGDRGSNLRDALRALAAAPGVAVVAVSSFHETEPLGPPQGRYLNAAAGLRTSLQPRELLELLQAIEARAGRERGPVRWSPRTLDLDLLFYDDARLDELDLVVPHPHLHERGFVLEPLRELAPDLVHPQLGATVTELAERVRARDALKAREGEEAAWRSRR